MQELPLVLSDNFHIFGVHENANVTYTPPSPPPHGLGIRSCQFCAAIGKVGVGKVSGSWRLGVGTGEWEVQSGEQGMESWW